MAPNSNKDERIIKINKERGLVAVSNKLITCDCGKMIGLKYVYRKEARPAIKLFMGGISKKKYK